MHENISPPGRVVGITVENQTFSLCRHDVLVAVFRDASNRLIDKRRQQQRDDARDNT